VLFGSEYWGGLVDWITKTVAGAGNISAPDLRLLHVTDDVDDMVRVVHDAYAAWQAVH
jgi:predicted Rossmann-fold nucleotide-binding protein